MKKDINYYLNLPYKINLVKLDDGDYFAEFDDKGLNKLVLMAGDGKTPNEAIQDLKDAFACYLEEALAKNEFIPEPMQKDKSKNLAITLKNSLVDEIDFYSKKMGLSRSAFLAVCAKAYIKTL
ncbi:type II toxin-antitoxin system HicB family antitoxin [Campylobacter hepaticus]|uniref:Type II toxin-antitoxin system HicB family antitoxin n=1 Tax=Campylobacter hepaticus TaxID=1813019 RepID=A0A424YYD3_9BACT|nr:type II toxin-antitoxin system HicB family antitoxin [Campylobacter hepaticus]RQD66464.1 type II toxin-antitoxin system HicB family antitoxin [Campylobacter hepaticus]RQD85868.1 type II toxin-antitoxin system HicB family antitoxin [Campylobacter hepaticus]